MWRQAGAILWAQWRTLLNFYPRSRGGFWFAATIGVTWYGMWAAGAVAAAFLMKEADGAATIRTLLAPGLLLALFYWQLIPVLMVSTGASLNLKRLLAYPIPHGQLFLLEVLLRVTTAGEVLLMLAGTSIGLWANPRVPWWAPLWFLPFVLFNLLLSAGVRDLLTRLFASRRFREIGVFVLLAAAALPQVLMFADWKGWRRGPLPELGQLSGGILWPSAATAHLASGEFAWSFAFASAAWLLAAGWFGRRQFERGLRFDEDAARATPAATAPPRAGWAESLFRLPGRFLPDPLAAMIEKDLRGLARTPRFRIVFVMGFSFGLLIWLPMAFRRGSQGLFAEHYLTFVCVYALMLLGEVPVWNAFGFDRSAAQIYFVAPVKTSTVLFAKNLTAVAVSALEVAIITLVCALFRFPVTLGRIAEAYCVVAIFLAYLVSIGNLSSVYYPRPSDPKQSWRTGSATRFQAYLLIIYPVLSLPFVAAYVARHAWDSAWVFAGVLALAALLAGIAYRISIELAVRAAEARKESILAALSQGEGPVAL